jgi:hypothetical protein
VSSRNWREALTQSPQGPASFDDPDLIIQVVLDGVGIGTAIDTFIGLIAEGRLVQVLKTGVRRSRVTFSTIPAVGMNLAHLPL